MQELIRLSLIVALLLVTGAWFSMGITNSAADDVMSSQEKTATIKLVSGEGGPGQGGGPPSPIPA